LSHFCKMSMYPQQQAFSQPTFPQGYPPQPPSYSLPSSSIYPVDPGSFRCDYTARLAGLTDNSRVIIQALSMYAHDFSRWGDVVTQCIEAHIRRVPPEMKLPAFYLVDALSKNVFDPYAGLFASIVAPLFLETYQQVDQQTRGKMEEMLLTWRTGAPNGRELFGIGPQLAIERGIWPSNPGQGSSHSSNAFVSRSQVLSELEFALRQKERILQNNPYDTVASNHIGILSQLRKLVEAGVSQEELAQILAQLRTLVRPSPANLAPPPAPAPVKYPPTTYPPSFTYHQTVAPNGASHVHSQYPMAHTLTYTNSAQQIQTPDTSRPLANTVVASTAPPVIPNISGLFDALVKAGVVSASSTPTGAGATIQAQEDSKTQPHDTQPSRESSVEDARVYRKAILAEDVRFSSAEISRHRPNIVHFLYDRMPVQCKQCGLRFSDTAQGKKTMQEHLDMHFRQNRKASQSVGRGHSRSWFLGVEDWIRDLPYSSGDKDMTGFSSRLSNAKAVASAESAKRDAEVRARFVVVPPGDEAKHVTCPICKEAFKSEFNEEDEEWIWKNALKFDDKIYHATCHAEALLTNGSLSARLRQGFIGSRSGTPDVPSSRRTTPPQSGKAELASPSSRLGFKRKVEVDSTDGRPDGSPPLKKVILASA
jgi:pre-mRNA cleavage complex 2 protein Pcf11